MNQIQRRGAVPSPARRVWTGVAMELLLVLAIAAIDGIHMLFFVACSVTLLMLACAVIITRLERRLGRIEELDRAGTWRPRT